MALSKFAKALVDNGINFYTKKTNNATITDISQFKKLACFMKTPNNKLVPALDTLVIFTGITTHDNKYLVMIDFDKLDNEQNMELYLAFNKFLKDNNIDTYFEKTMRNGYHYFFISNVLYTSSTKLSKNNIDYDIDIRGYGGKSISYGTKFGSMKVIAESKHYQFADLHPELVNMFNLQPYNADIDIRRNNEIGNPGIGTHDSKKTKKIKILSDDSNSDYDEFQKIKPLDIIINNDANIIIDDNYKKVKLILTLLGSISKYYTNYNEWRNIGFCLGTLSKKESIKDPNIESELLKLYLSFSALYKYWNIDAYNMACNIFYSSKCNITLGTLIYNLKKHDDLYKKYIELSSDHIFIDMCNSPTHGYVARFYHSLFPDRYIYDDNINKWYILLDSNIWEILKDHTRRIRIHLKDTILSFLNNKLKTIGNREDGALLRDKYNKVITKINTEDFMKNTYNALKDYYLQIDVTFDECPHIFAFKNGYCFDFTKGSKVIRKISPDEHITMHTGYDYKEADNDNIEFINKFIYSLFENEDEIKFIIKCISNALYGNNKSQKCYFFLGIGANGKSVLLTLLENAFGNYGMKSSATLFTKPEKDALISPELVQCKYKRFLHISEPNPDDKIQQSRYKSTTGNERITARSLFSNDIESYIPAFTPFISCNQLPMFEKIDEAIKRRSILIKFKFRFTANPEFENDRIIDPSLHDTIKNANMGLAMAHILYNAFEHNYDAMNHIPDSCQQLINEFLSNNDPTHDFLNSRYIQINKNDKNYRISVNELYDLYKRYITNEFNDVNMKPIPQRKFIDLITNRGFIKTRINFTFIYGIRKYIQEPIIDPRTEIANIQDVNSDIPEPIIDLTLDSITSHNSNDSNLESDYDIDM